MKNEFLNYGKQSIDDQDIKAVADVLKSDFLTTGPQIEKFEQSLSNHTQAKYAVACGNGTQALHLACLAAGLKTGDYAIIPAITFLATANAVRYCGADVIFCDVDKDTGLMNAEHLNQALSENKDKNIKAVLPVHLAGQICDMVKIHKIAKQNGLKIIEDCSHAIGSEYNNIPCGNCKYSDFSTFSFHPVKTIAMGEGGAITTNNEAAAEKMRTLRSHGMEKDGNQEIWAYNMNDLGYNYRVSDMQCALGISQMSKLNKFIKRRQEIANLYDELFKPLNPVIRTPVRVRWCDPAWHLYALRIDFKALTMDRGQMMHRLKDKNIGTQVHYIPVSSQPYYQTLYGKKHLEGAEHYYEHTLSIPLYPAMNNQDVEYVASAIKEIIHD